MVPLSVLDLVPVRSGFSTSAAIAESVELARLCERLGFTRYWLAEHHGMASIASSVPEILIERVASATSRIRVGSGGIMLPNHTPLRVAEAFHTLEALHPAVCDLLLMCSHSYSFLYTTQNQTPVFTYLLFIYFDFLSVFFLHLTF